MNVISKVKTHFQENKNIYIGATIGFALAGITYLIVRHSQLDQRSITVLPRRGYTVPDVKAEGYHFERFCLAA